MQVRPQALLTWSVNTALGVSYPSKLNTSKIVDTPKQQTAVSSVEHQTAALFQTDAHNNFNNAVFQPFDHWRGPK